MRPAIVLMVLLAGSPVLAADLDFKHELISATVPAPEGKGQDWPVFLGPHGTGVSDETNLLAKWPENGPPILWEKSVGSGYSAPSVRGNRLVLHHRTGDREIIECFRADTGETLWRSSYSTGFADPYGYSNGPRCTPLLTAERCYTYGPEGKLVCTELATGKLIWSRDVYADFQIPKYFFGIGCTPVLEGKVLIALVGGQPNSGVVGFDADTGKTLWDAVGKETWDGAKTGWTNDPTCEWTGEEQIVSYSTPNVVTLHGKRHCLCLMRHGLVSLDPATGKENFRYWFRSRAYESVNAARPITIGDKIFLSAAYRVGSVLLQVAADGKSVKEVWRDEKNMLTHFSTAIHVDGKIYGFSGRHKQEGELRCIDLKDGHVLWKTNGLLVDLNSLGQDPTTGKIFDKATKKVVPWPFFGRGSMTQYEDKFIILGESGTFALAKIDGAKYDELFRTSYKQISFPSWTAPVLSRKRLYLRDDDSLMCLDLRP